jgi:hypothetical protein
MVMASVWRRASARLPSFKGGLKATSTQRLLLIIAIVLIAPTIASACPVCFGDPNAPMQKGVNNGIWVLLGVIGFVQVGLVALFWSFWRRARELQRRRDSLRVIEGGAH